MLQMFKKGIKLHNNTAEQLKVSYEVAKRINHAISYAIGEQALADLLSIDILKAKDYIQAFYRAPRP